MSGCGIKILSLNQMAVGIAPMVNSTEKLSRCSVKTCSVHRRPVFMFLELSFKLQKEC